jgi:hypothetical protein
MTKICIIFVLPNKNFQCIDSFLHLIRNYATLINVKIESIGLLTEINK